MKTIEPAAHPTRQTSATLADVWRLEPGAPASTIRIRAMLPGDFASIRKLQERAHPSLPPDTYQQLEHQMDAFPEGQLVAEATGAIVGTASNLVVQWDHYALDHRWRSVTGEGFFSNHDMAGKTLFAVDTVVEPRRRGDGIARELYKARRKLCQRMNLRRIIAAVRLSGYANLRDAMTPELYAKRVVWGDIPDPALRFMVSQGFQYCGVIHDYQPQDLESCGNAALVVWLNPRFVPKRPAILRPKPE